MIDEKQFTDSLMQYNVGSLSSRLAVEEKRPAEEGINPNLSSGGVEVAGLASRLGSGFAKLLKKSAPDIVKERASKAAKPPTISLDEAASLVDRYSVSKEAGDPINYENLGKILNNVETSEDLMRLVDIAGTAEEVTTKQTFAEIAEDSDVFKDLAPILDGSQRGLFTAKQQYGLRRLLSSSGEKAVELANRIAEGDHTPELLIEYQQTFSAFDSLYKMARGNARETARALNQQKMLAETMSGRNLAEMKAALQITGGTPEGNGIISSAENLVKRLEGGKSAIESMAYVIDKKLNLYTRGAVELWKNNILSGLGTHTTNLASVAVTNLWENFVIRPTAVGIGAARSALTGNKDRVLASEIAYQQMGSLVGFRSSLQMFKDAFVSGESKFGAGDKMETTGAVQQIASELTGGSKVGEAIADISTISFRLLRAEDDAMRGIVFTSELYALAARKGRLDGLKGVELMEYVDKTVDSPPDEIYEQAMKEASRKTFTEGDLKGAVGMLAKYTRAMTGQIPALQFIIPFVNTPANLLQYAMDTSILAAVSPRLWREVTEGGAKADIALAKISTGTSLSIMIWQMYEAGLISGDGPSDYSMQKQMEKEGWKPNAIKAPNGKWYQIKRMEPFSTSLGFVADTLDKAKYASSEDEAKKYMAHAMLTLAESAFDSSWASGAAGFFEAVGDPAKWDNYQARFIASFVPYSASVRTAEMIQDPTTAMVSNDPQVNKKWYQLAMERVKASTPWLSKSLRPARYWDGTVIEPEEGGFAFALTPIKQGVQGEGDMVNRELIRNGVSASEPKPVINVGYASFSLLDLAGGNDYLYDAYLVEVGRARREILEKVTTDSRYSAAEEGSGGQRFALLQRALSKAKKVGLKNFLDNAMTWYLETPEGNTIGEQMFAADPISFVKSLSKELGNEIDMNIKERMVPRRGTLELPTEQSYVPRF